MDPPVRSNSGRLTKILDSEGLATYKNKFEICERLDSVSAVLPQKFAPDSRPALGIHRQPGIEEVPGAELCDWRQRQHESSQKVDPNVIAHFRRLERDVGCGWLLVTIASQGSGW